MKKDFIVTFATEFAVLASGILVYKLAVFFLGKEGFSEYALCRRTVSLIQPLFLLGLSVGIPRYMAYAQAGASPGKSDAYFISGLSSVVMSAVALAAVMNAFRDGFAFLLLGNSEYSYFIFPISLMLVGRALHASCYSYFRGRLLMFRANALQAVNLGCVPLLAFSVADSVPQLLMITGASWAAISFLTLSRILWKAEWEKGDMARHAKELLAYGLQRVPGDFGMAALLSLPATITAHVSGITEAGHVAFGISLVNMFGGAFGPIGLILLPKASQIIASKDIEMLRYYVRKCLKITFLLTTAGVAVYETFAPEILNLYLGESFPDLVTITRVVVFGSLMYTVYVSMRSIIDAYYFRAVNTINILASLAVFLVLSGIVVLLKAEYIYISVCFLATVFLLGGLTLFDTRRIFSRTSHAI